MAAPVETPRPDPRAICQVLLDATGDNAPSVSDPVQLFAADYIANNGNLLSLSPSRINAADYNSSSNKRPAHGSPSKSPSKPSRTSKRQLTSPRRRAAAGTVAAALNVVTQFTQPTPINRLEPPLINRDGDGPYITCGSEPVGYVPTARLRT